MQSIDGKGLERGYRPGVMFSPFRTKLVWWKCKNSYRLLLIQLPFLTDIAPSDKHFFFLLKFSQNKAQVPHNVAVNVRESVLENNGFWVVPLKVEHVSYI